MITLLAPVVTKAQRTELERHKANLEETIEAVQQHANKLSEFASKERSLQRAAASLRSRAAKFELEAETNLASTQKQIERVQIAKKEAESFAASYKPALFKVIIESRESIQKICQHSYHELITQIASAFSPFFDDFARAKYHAKAAGIPAVSDLTRDLLSPRLLGDESVEIVNQAAKETLSKVNSLLDGSEIWRFPGCEPPRASEEMAA